MKLKRTCRTCSNLSPITYTDDYYDSEENYYKEKYPANCEYVDYNEDVDALTTCEHYKPINLKWILEEGKIDKSYVGKYFIDKRGGIAYECVAQIHTPLYIVLIEYLMESKTYKIVVYNEEETEKYLEENEYIESLYFNKEDDNYIRALQEIRGE